MLHHHVILVSYCITLTLNSFYLTKKTKKTSLTTRVDECTISHLKKEHSLHAIVITLSFIDLHLNLYSPVYQRKESCFSSCSSPKTVMVQISSYSAHICVDKREYPNLSSHRATFFPNY